jgi:hypothetical protein
MDWTRKTRDRDVRTSGDDEKTMSKERLDGMVSKSENGNGVRSVVHKHGVDDNSVGGLSEGEEIARKRETNLVARGIGAKCLRDGRVDLTRKDVMAS